MNEKHVFQRGGQVIDQLCGLSIQGGVCNQVADAPIHQMGDIQRAQAVAIVTNSKDDKELIEAVAAPWICVEEKSCEETVAVHWEEVVTALAATLATTRKEARFAAFKECARLATMIAAGETYETGRQKALNIAAAIEAAANTEKKGGEDG